MAGRGRATEGNRTTASNVWKPPPSEGTTSPQRALRWQTANPGEKERDDDDDDSKTSPEDSRSSKSGSTNQTSGTRSSKSSKKKAKSAAKKVEEEEDEDSSKDPGQFEWFGDPLKPGIEASLGEGGDLHRFVKKGKPRPGMCNPPMNEKVRALLVADLNEWKVEPIVTSKIERRKQEEALERARRKEASKRKIVVPASNARHPHQEELAAEESRQSSHSHSHGEAGWSGSATMPGGFAGGSVGSSRMSSPALVSRKGTRHLTGGSIFVKKGKKKGESAWQLDDLTQEGKPKKHGLEAAPEGEVNWRLNKLKLASREHGFILEKMDVEDLGLLSRYHNWFSRGPLQHPPPPVHPVIPSRRVKDIGNELASTSHCLSGLSDEVQKDLLKEFVQPRKFRLGPTQEAPSMERLMEMAMSAKHWGPNMLEQKCRQSNVSVHTTGKLPADGADLEDDPLFSSRMGSACTSTGKPLPVPHWGRNGNAPELRQARSAAELQIAR